MEQNEFPEVQKIYIKEGKDGVRKFLKGLTSDEENPFVGNIVATIKKAFGIDDSPEIGDPGMGE